MKKSKNKNLIYWKIGILILLLIIGLLMVFVKINEKKIIKKQNVDLIKYRSSEIPEKCRIPEYENNLESWKEHLSHHENTLFCLDYYK